MFAKPVMHCLFSRSPAVVEGLLDHFFFFQVQRELLSFERNGQKFKPASTTSTLEQKEENKEKSEKCSVEYFESRLRKHRELIAVMDIVGLIKKGYGEAQVPDTFSEAFFRSDSKNVS